MSAYNSDQVNQTLNPPNTKLKPNEEGGRERILRFTYTVSASSPLNIADTITTQVLPKGARIFGGNVTFGAAGASATLSVGKGASLNGNAAVPAAYLNAADVHAAGSSLLANTQALNYGDELTDDTPLLLTAAGANFANGTVIAGHVSYVID